MGRLSFFPLWIIQRHVFVGIPVRPAIDGNGLDVGLMIEAVLAEQSLELVADFLLITSAGAGVSGD